MRRIKTGFLVLAAAVLLTFSASGAVLADTAPVLQEDLGYGVRYAFSDTHTDSGALKIHTVSFRPSEKKAELKLDCRISRSAVCSICWEWRRTGTTGMGARWSRG